MLLEGAVAAAMYWADRAIAAESPSLIPQTQQQCRHRDPQKLKQCLNSKMQDQPDPYAAMWDSNWVSTITYSPEDVVPQQTAPKR